MFLKQIFILLLLTVFCTSVKAQGSFSNTGSGLNDLGRYMDDDSSSTPTGDDDFPEDAPAKGGDPLADITIDAADSLVVFGNIPEKTNVLVHITNAEGIVLTQKTAN